MPALANWPSEIFSKKCQAKFYKNTVLNDIANHDWEGEIKAAGNKVIIRAEPDVAVQKYTGTITYQTLPTSSIELLIDQEDYYAFKLDSVTKHQSNIEIMDKASADASKKMKISVDAQVLGTAYADIPVANQLNGGVKVQLTKDNILDFIVDAGTVLDENDVPEEGRWMVLPPWACGLIKKSDLKDASIAGDGTSIMRNGRLGMIDRFTIYHSNSVAVVNDGTHDVAQIMAGTKHFVSFASQFTESRSMELENEFGTGVSGLMVWGMKVTKPEAAVLIKAYK